MVRLSLQDRVRIVVYFEQGVSQRQIAAQLHCSHTAVQKVVRKYRSTGSVEDLPKSGRPQVLTAREKRIAVNLSKKDRFRPATSIRDDLETNYGTSVSVATIKRTLVNAGMHGRIARRKPYLSRVNRKRRLRFALQHKNWSVEDWSQIIFSDESKFQLYKSNGRTYVRRSVGEALDPKCVQQTVKHGGGNVMVWGAFTFLGVSELSRISHRMKAADYVQLLENSLLPFLHRFPEGEKIFQHDNAPIHTAKQTSKFFEQAQISVMEWPAQSPDLNPIEHLWDAIDRMTRLRMAESNNGTNLESLYRCLQESWSNVSPDTLFNLLQSMPTRINAVIQAKGGHTQY